MKDPSKRVKVENDSTRIRSCMSASEKEQNNHAIAIAETVVAAADAAVAGAQAAVAVVRLTCDGRGTLFSGRGKWAATKIQSVYRGHLARRTLRALRGLVKFQALVKGFVVRKRVNDTLYNMQTLLRAQMAVRFQRSHCLFKDHRVQPQICDKKSTARRALRALRGLVKFQVLVKGFVVRKRVTATLYSMQALLRAQLVVRFQMAHRIDETKACEEMDSKLNITNKKKQILVKRKRILEVDKPPGLSRSYSFDSSLSGMRVVDAQDDNKILARQENVSRMIKSVSYDCEVLFLEEASSDDCSVEETEDLVKESLVSTHDENEGEKEEFDEVEDGSGWSRNVLLQYLFLVILLILTIVPLCVMNSETVSHSEVGYKGFVPMILMDENLSENMICYDHEKWDTKDLE
ncbi:IQ-DOMAIN 14-like protein [Tanacetum coccineum]